jgi:AraC family transcriptional activator FtrA
LGLYLIGKDWGITYVEQIEQKLRLAPGFTATILTKLNTHAFNTSAKIKTVLAWANEHLEAIDNIGQLAGQACLSRRSFDRQFRASEGMSPKDWLTRRRLLRAKEYLRGSELSIAEIAVATGFGTCNSFRVNFQKLTGHCPTAYRRELEFQTI